MSARACARRRFRRPIGVLSDRSGGAAVEMALAAPIIVALLFGAYEIGWAFLCGSSVRSAVEVSARSLLSNPNLNSSDLQAAVQSRLSNLPITGLTVTVSKVWLNGNVQVARVSWNYQYDMVLPYVPQVSLRFDSTMTAPIASESF